MKSGKSRLQIIVLLLFFAFAGFSIARFLSVLVINPDSTGYITAAQNLIHTGHMFEFANSPSWSLLPAIEPYTEQPPGFPLFLVPFLLIFKGPVAAAAVAQSFAILIFYSAVYALTIDLEAGPFFQVLCALVFTLFWPLQAVFSTAESETLFIALSFLTVHFIVASRFSPKIRYYWLAALLCAAAATLTRTVGALMLLVFVLASWRQAKSRWILMALSVIFVVGPWVAWSLRNKILYGSISMTHVVNDHIAFEKLFPELVFLLDLVSRNAFVILFMIIFVVLCLSAPLIGPVYPWIRQIRFSFNHFKIHPLTILLSLLGLTVTFVSLAADRLGFGGDPEIGLKQVAIACLGIVIALLPWWRRTNISSYIHAWKMNYDRNRLNTRPMATFGLLFLAGLSHFWGITGLSLVTPFSALETRLLSPSLALLLFSGLAGMYFLLRLVPGKIYLASIYIIAFSLILLSPFFVTTGLPFQPGIRIPPEQALWKEIYALPGISKATHFYSDYNFTHQIFGNRPQRIILDVDQIASPGFLSRIMATGQCPFVIVNQGDKMSQLMDQYYQDANLIRLEMLNGQFELFAQPCLLSP